MQLSEQGMGVMGTEGARLTGKYAPEGLRDERLIIETIETKEAKLISPFDDYRKKRSPPCQIF